MKAKDAVLIGVNARSVRLTTPRLICAPVETSATTTEPAKTSTI